MSRHYFKTNQAWGKRPHRACPFTRRAVSVLMAKGALKSKKRFGGGVLEPTHCVNISFKEGREGAMSFLNEAKLEKDFAGIRTDLDRLNTAMHFLQVVRKVSQEGYEEQRSLFNILGHALTQLATCSNIQT